MTRGRVVKPYVAKPTKPTKAEVPTGDIVLRDGRVLRLDERCQGELEPHREGQRAAMWESEDGMLVQASLENTRAGRCLYVSLAYRDADKRPTLADVGPVRSAFFPVGTATREYVRDNRAHLVQIPKRKDARR